MSAPKNTAVIIGAGFLQINLIKEAKKRYKVIVADQNENAAGVPFADIFLQVSTKDTHALLNALEPYKKELALCAVSGTDMTQAVSAINEKFNLPGINSRQSLVLSHKGKMREFCKEYKIKHPNFIVSCDKKEAFEWAQKNNHPHGFVIKPTQNMGARGVMLLNSADDLSFAFEFAASYSENKEIILEEYLPGDEYSVDALVYRGQVYITGFADRLIELKDERYFIETGHTMPSQAGKNIWKAVEKCMQQYADALSEFSKNPYHGALKADLRLFENEIYVGEMAGRLSGGFMSTHTYPYASGNNLMSAYLDILKNRLPEFIKEGRHNSYKQVCLERAITASSGKLKSFEFTMPKTNENEGFLNDTLVHFKPGDLIFSLKNNIGKLANYIVSARKYETAEKLWVKIKKNIKYEIEMPVLTKKEIRQESRRKFDPHFCRVCCVCDGKNCASAVPGMGGIEKGTLFRKNREAVKNIKIIENINNSNHKPEDIDVSFEIFGKKFAAPVLCAPVTGSQTNMGGSITEWDLGIEIGSAAVAANVLPFFGDGASDDKYLASLNVIKSIKNGIVIFKPRKENHEIIQRIKTAEKFKALAWGIDIDAVKLKTLEIKGVQTAEKTTDDLIELSKASKLPFIIKGVTNKKEADIACLAGASVVVISNHGGRVDNSLPDTVTLVRELVAYVKQTYPKVKVFADGGIRSGEDLFKIIALGADAALIGRPIAIAAVGLGRIGVYSLLQNYLSEFTDTMKNMNLKSIKDINSRYICI